MHSCCYSLPMKSTIMEQLHNTELSHPPEQCGGIQHDSSEGSLAHSNSHTSQKWSERELIDLGQNHAKDSANNLTIYMTD